MPIKTQQCVQLHPSERVNWIISTIPQRISKNIFVYGSYEFLAMLEAKIREAPFFKVQSGKITVCDDKRLGHLLYSPYNGLIERRINLLPHSNIERLNLTNFVPNTKLNIVCVLNIKEGRHFVALSYNLTKNEMSWALVIHLNQALFLFPRAHS